MRVITKPRGAPRPATLVAMTLVTLVAVFQSIFLYLSIDAQRDAAHIIDISGAQRMRTQQLAYLALSIHAGAPEPNVRSQIATIVAAVRATRAEIMREPQYITGRVDARGRTPLARTADAYIARVLDVERHPHDPIAIAAVMHQRLLVLAAFDAAVKKRVAVATARNDRLVAVIFLGLVFQIAVVIGIWRTIVVPYERRRRELFDAVLQARAEIESTFTWNPDAIAVYDANGILTRVNHSRERLYGKAPKHLIGKHYEELVAESDIDRAREAFERARSGETVRDELKLRAYDGSLVDVSVSLFPRLVENELTGVNVVSKDISKLRAAEAAASEQMQRLSDLYEIASAHGRTSEELLGSALQLVGGRIGYDSGAVTEVVEDTDTVLATFGDSPGVAVGSVRALENSLAGLTMAGFDVFEVRDFQAATFPMADLQGLGWGSVAGMRISVGGKLFGTICFASNAMRKADLSPADIGFIRLACALIGTIIERSRQIRRLDAMAFVDFLTELPNRAHFVNVLSDAIACGRTFALHYIDLDRFKYVNDRYGHAVGDSVLSVTAQRLRRCARGDDVVVRLGGDEFAIIQLGRVDRAGAEVLAQRLIAEFSSPVDIDGITHDVGASIGIALYPVDASDSKGLIEAADTALYDAKHAGRLRYVFAGTVAPQPVEAAKRRS
jgi:diguanylate cyclase (GGDEF)-like protein/PAS domain S-box-containing protein